MLGFTITPLGSEKMTEIGHFLSPGQFKNRGFSLISSELLNIFQQDYAHSICMTILP